MKKSVFLFLALCVFKVEAQTPVVVSDLVYQGVSYGYQSINPYMYGSNTLPEVYGVHSNFVLLGSIMCFATRIPGTQFGDNTKNDVLWKSIGTTNTTVVVKAFKRISNEMIAFNGKVYFGASGSDEIDTELWQSDGTESGTIKIDVNIGNSGVENSYPSNFYIFNQELYFTAENCSGCSRKLMKLSLSGLPVELLTFTAKPNNNKVQLDWKTATELNTLGFDIERSTDGQTWSKLGFVGAKNLPSEYQYFDQNPKLNEVNYYRLCTVDIDGKKEFSKIVGVKMNEVRTPIKIYPSVTEGVIQIETTLNIQQVWVSNANGQIVLTSTESSLNLRPFPTGVYVVTVKGNDSIFSETIFKQ